MQPAGKKNVPYPFGKPLLKGPVLSYHHDRRRRRRRDYHHHHHIAQKVIQCSDVLN